MRGPGGAAPPVHPPPRASTATSETTGGFSQTETIRERGYAETRRAGRVPTSSCTTASRATWAVTAWVGVKGPRKVTGRTERGRGEEVRPPHTQRPALGRPHAGRAPAPSPRPPGPRTRSTVATALADGTCCRLRPITATLSPGPWIAFRPANWLTCSTSHLLEEELPGCFCEGRLTNACLCCTVSTLGTIKW